MQNRILSVFVSTVIFILPLSVFGYASGVTVSAVSAIVMNVQTGEIVFEKNSLEQRPMASTTKIMTAILALEYGDFNKTITVKDEDAKVEGTSIGLKKGDKITLDVLVSGMLLESGNDAANVTATAVSGNTTEFVKLMNRKAELLGMKNTSFANPSGLPQDGHYSTAYDMALLASYAVKNTRFCEICSQKSMRVSYGNPSYERTFSNHNRLLDTVDGVFGIKTGFTKAAGRCLVSAAKRNNVTLVVVTLNAPDDWNDHKKLYEYGFSVTKEKTVDFGDTIKVPVVGSDKKYIIAKPDGVLSYSYTDAAESFVTRIFCEHFLYAGIKKGDKVGFVRVINGNGKVICECNLLSAQDAQANFEEKNVSHTAFEKLKEFLQGKT